MKVIKFGGSSVGSNAGMLQVKQIVEAQQEPVIVVVSALFCVSSCSSGVVVC